MATTALGDLLGTIRRLALLDAQQLEEVARAMHGKTPEPRAILRALLQRGWLTNYQAERLSRGKANDLQLGQYLLLDQIGEGGMGQVFKARHRGLGRIVALKVIRQDRVANAEAIRRFQREIQVAAQLTHPNIVLAFDADRIGDTLLFVMEYVEGIDLGKMLKDRSTLPIGQAANYIRQAALGLQHAHEKGMVHRDIKPSNLLLCNKTGLVKVLDLGLSRLQTPSTDSTMDATLTHDGSVMGTPDYMSPEQARDSHTVDIRGDIYSLGCTLYHLLTGQPPFPDGTGMEKVFKHTLEEPILVEKLRTQVPGKLAAVIRKMMAKKPEDRYATPAAAAAALEPFAKLEPATPTIKIDKGRQPTRATVNDSTQNERPRSQSRQGRRMAAVGVVALLVASVILGSLFLGSKTSPTAKSTDSIAQATNFTPSTVPIVPVDPGGKGDIGTLKNLMPLEIAAVFGNAAWRPSSHQTCLAWSPNGSRLATAGRGRLVHIWDARTGQEVATLAGHKFAIHALAFSPDGKWLASASADRMVRLWDAVTGKESATLEEHTALVRALAFSPNSQWLASGGLDRSVRLWDVATRKVVFKLPESAPIQALQFSPDNKTLAVTALSHEGDSAIKLYDVADRQSRQMLNFKLTRQIHTAFVAGGLVIVYTDSLTTPVKTLVQIFPPPAVPRKFPTIEGPVTGIASTPDGQGLVVMQPGIIRILDLKNGTLGKPLQNSTPPTMPEALALSPDGRTVAALDAQRGIQLWDIEKGVKPLAINQHRGPVNLLAFTPDGARLVSGSGTEQGSIKTWDVTTGKERYALNVPYSTLDQLQVIDQGKGFANWGAGGVLSWQTDSGQPRWSILDDAVSTQWTAVTPDGLLTASSTGDGQIRLLEGPKGKAGAPLPGHKGGCCAGAFSSDGNLLATAGNADGQVKVWDIKQRILLASFPAHARMLGPLVFLPGDRQLAVGGSEIGRTAAQVKIWDIASQKADIINFDPEIIIHRIRFSPNARYMVLAGASVVRLIELTSGKSWDLYNGPNLTVFPVAFSPDQRFLAHANRQGLIRIWDLDSQTQYADWGLPGSVSSLAFAPDSRHLATGNHNGTISLLKVSRLPAIRPVPGEIMPGEDK